MEAQGGADGAAEVVAGNEGAGSTQPASPPAEGKSKAAEAGNAAPPAQTAREAFDRLQKGEKPDAVNAALYPRKGKADPAAAAAATTAAAAPKKDAASTTPNPETPGTATFPEAMDKKDVQVLKRGKIDPEVWAAIPPSNQTKILNGLRTSQAAADRAFQQGKAGKGAAGGTDPTGGAQQQQPESEDGVAPTDAEGELSAEALAAADVEQPKPGKKAAATKAATPPAGDFNVDAFLDPKDLETLQLLGGDELAETHKRTIGKVVAHFQEQQGALTGVLSHLLNEHIDGHFNRAVGELATQPGLDGLKPDHADYAKNSAALKAKALQLHRAVGDPTGYPFGEAVKDAAASLYRVNVHQAAQARLLTQRRQSLQGAADRGDSRRSQPRTLDPKERGRAIFAELAKGASPDQARSAVDGA